MNNAAVADPVWTQCFKKSLACGAILDKCKKLMKPFSKPRLPKWKQLFK